MDVGRTVRTCWSIEIIARGLFSLELEGAGRGQNLGAAQSRRRRRRAVREMRANGMETPFHPLQITTWFLFPVVTGEYFALLMPVLSPLARYIVTPCYCLFVALSLLSATVTSGIDPHDPHVPTNPRPSSTHSSVPVRLLAHADAETRRFFGRQVPLGRAKGKAASQ